MWWVKPTSCHNPKSPRFPRVCPVLCWTISLQPMQFSIRPSTACPCLPPALDGLIKLQQFKEKIKPYVHVFCKFLLFTSVTAWQVLPLPFYTLWNKSARPNPKGISCLNRLIQRGADWCRLGLVGVKLELVDFAMPRTGTMPTAHLPLPKACQTRVAAFLSLLPKLCRILNHDCDQVLFSCSISLSNSVL